MSKVQRKMEVFEHPVTGFKVGKIAARDLRVGDRILNTKLTPAAFTPPITAVSLEGNALSYECGEQKAGPIMLGRNTCWLISASDA